MDNLDLTKIPMATIPLSITERNKLLIEFQDHLKAATEAQVGLMEGVDGLVLTPAEITNALKYVQLTQTEVK